LDAFNEQEDEMKTILKIEAAGELQLSINGRPVESVIVTEGSVLFLQEREVWKRCGDCNGTGIGTASGWYCACQTGVDLRNQANRGFQAPALGDEG
jgi:hypothetical protein